MSTVKTSQNFEKEAKKLLKKYRSLAKEIAEVIDELSQNPDKGTPVGKTAIKFVLLSKVRGKASLEVGE